MFRNQQEYEEVAGKPHEYTELLINGTALRIDNADSLKNSLHTHKNISISIKIKEKLIYWFAKQEGGGGVYHSPGTMAE